MTCTYSFCDSDGNLIPCTNGEYGSPIVNNTVCGSSLSIPKPGETPIPGAAPGEETPIIPPYDAFGNWSGTPGNKWCGTLNRYITGVCPPSTPTPLPYVPQVPQPIINISVETITFLAVAAVITTGVFILTKDTISRTNAYTNPYSVRRGFYQTKPFLTSKPNNYNGYPHEW